MRRLSLSAAAAILLLAALAGPALADPPGALDQGNDPAATGGGELPGIYEHVQTFTVGQTGDLTGAQLYMYGTAATFVSIRALDGAGFPTGADLVSASVVPGAEWAWVDVVFPTPLAVTSGETYGLFYHHDPSGGVDDWHTLYTPDTYAGGKAYRNIPTLGGWTEFSGRDFVFRTWVLAAPQPTQGPATPPPTATAGEIREPGSTAWWLPLGLILAAAGTLLVTNRRLALIR